MNAIKSRWVWDSPASEAVWIKMQSLNIFCMTIISFPLFSLSSRSPHLTSLSHTSCVYLGNGESQNMSSTYVSFAHINHDCSLWNAIAFAFLVLLVRYWNADYIDHVIMWLAGFQLESLMSSQALLCGTSSLYPRAVGLKLCVCVR